MTTRVSVKFTGPVIYLTEDEIDLFVNEARARCFKLFDGEVFDKLDILDKFRESHKL